MLSNTCSRSVGPVNGETRAMTIFRILWPWTTKRERRCTRTVITPLWKKRACELEGTQWCIDRHESFEQQTSFASQWWNPCDDEGPFSSREECQKSCGVCTETWTPAPALQQYHHPRQDDLTMEERGDLMVLLIPVRNELHDRGEDPALVELVYQLMDRLLDADTSEIADDARSSSPRTVRSTLRSHDSRQRRG